jgi:hypothetical protein
MKEQISICENCGTPLIFTFRWAYKEKFCLNCGSLGDMFMGETVDLTPELKLKYKIVNKIWKALYGKNKPLLPLSQYKRKGCKKCEDGGNHNEHLNKKEIRNHKVAEKILKQLERVFN